MKKKAKYKTCECCNCRIPIYLFNDQEIPLCCLCDTAEEIQKWIARKNIAALKIDYNHQQ